ncbi:MAG TPA: winged helix-turn-helix domain-containing protein [Candidatus Bathyarchaeia archaeon]|nr:winged helix-turn-helix domain-containing protein [Candidatus Bathyarchaeia archaeon]
MIESKTATSNNHRGNLDIIADILVASHGGVKKTYLMYRCNLSFKQLKNYSHFLVNNGLLLMTRQQEKTDYSLFELTQKGREFLKAYKGLKALIE